MQEFTEILIGEGKYHGHVMTRKLPVKLDNALYTLIHFIGGLTTREVINFADKATEDDLEELYRLLIDFPNTIQDIMPLAGSYQVLRKSKEWQEIVNFLTNQDKEINQLRLEIERLNATNVQLIQQMNEENK